MNILEVKNLNKTYPNFKLDNICFNINESKIVGFIGRNGAGKTTTIKSILNLIHIDSGKINYFNRPLNENELYIKNNIGYCTGAISYYPRKKIKDIVNVIKRFYDTWDEDSYRQYLDLFELDDNITPHELSEGMKVKVNLLLALSHKAKLLILDEPTSNLDPFSRDELLELFNKLKQKEVSILFSTHIVSDIEKCCDDIIYISKGKIISNSSKAEFIQNNSLINETLEQTILRLERGNHE